MTLFDLRVALKRVAFVAVVFSAVCAGASVDQPNILFIAVDDLRPELGSYGAVHIQSPNMDKLAASGVIFNRAYCQVAVCGASRCSLLSGLQPAERRFKQYDSRVDEDAPGAITLPQEFREQGYTCLSIGKIFHHRDDAEARSWSEPAWRPADVDFASMLDPESANFPGKRAGRGPVFEHPDVPDNAYPDGQNAERAIEDLRRLKKEGNPFFLAVGFTRPHLPFYAPKKYWDLYDPEAIALADNRYHPKNTTVGQSGEIHFYNKRGMKYNSDEWHRVCRHGYYACVSYVDALIGRVVAELDELGLRESTIIVLWGDHGFHLGEHNMWCKANTMHLATRSPLLVSGPGIEAGQERNQLVELIDIYPTLCQMAGIVPRNQELQGSSFVPVLTEPDLEWKTAAFSSYGPMRSVMTERFNYCEFRDGHSFLFDRLKDPNENCSVAGNPEYKEPVGRLSQLLKDYWNASSE